MAFWSLSGVWDREQDADVRSADRFESELGLELFCEHVHDHHAGARGGLRVQARREARPIVGYAQGRSVSLSQKADSDLSASLSRIGVFECVDEHLIEDEPQRQGLLRRKMELVYVRDDGHVIVLRHYGFLYRIDQGGEIGP